MSKSVNLEIISIDDGFAVLEMENGAQIDIDLQYLPENLREGRFLKFVISHTDYNPDKEDYKFENKVNLGGFPKIPNGKNLTY